MRVTFVGTGDAFGSGGRLNTCFHVAAGETRFLIDCGASSLIGLKRLGLDRNATDAILITHFHGDHFGGLPYFILDAQFFAKRRRPLTILGPPGVAAALEAQMEAAFPGSSKTRQKFELEVREIAPGEAAYVHGSRVNAEAVVHGPPGTCCLALRIETGGKTLAYTGDTEWTESLIEIGRNADLLIAEAYMYDKQVPYHLDLKTLERRLPDIRPKRLILTHMSDDMLARIGGLTYEAAYDGHVVEVA